MSMPKQKEKSLLNLGLLVSLLFGCIPSQQPPSARVVIVDPPAAPSSAGGPPVGMVPIPEGSFFMGEKFIPVVVSPFYLDQTEVTAEAYEACVTAGKCHPPATGKTLGKNASLLCHWDDRNTPFQVAAGKKNHPINCVTFWEAKAYCQAQGKRLPTNTEWEYAAQGSDQSRFPWGNAAPTLADQPRRLCWGRYEILPGISLGTCAVKGYPATLLGREESQLKEQGLAGLYDMAGNVMEWVDTQFDSGPSDKNVPCVGSCLIRNGSWANGDGDSLLFKSIHSNGRVPSFPDYTIGFRCARDL